MKSETKSLLICAVIMSIVVIIITVAVYYETEQIDEEFITEVYNESILVGKYSTVALNNVIIHNMNRVYVPVPIVRELSEPNYVIVAYDFSKDNKATFNYTSVIDMNVDSEEREVVWSLYNSNNTILPCTITTSEVGKCEVDDFGVCLQNYTAEISCIK